MTRSRPGSLVALSALLMLPTSAALASSLHGSHSSMVRQHAMAVKNDFTFARTSSQLRALVNDDRLIRVRSTKDLLVAEGVSFAYTRPLLKLFLQRLAGEYHTAMDERLVVTSLTRPLSLQPDNASPLSVHPAGMAIDLRVPDTRAKRSWLEQTLLALEDKGILDVTREHHPSHYHVAVFPEKYAAYLTRLGVDTTVEVDSVEVELEPAMDSAATPAVVRAAITGSPATAVDGLRYTLIAAVGYLLAVLGAGTSVLRKTKARR